MVQPMNDLLIVYGETSQITSTASELTVSEVVMSEG